MDLTEEQEIKKAKQLFQADLLDKVQSFNSKYYARQAWIDSTSLTIRTLDRYLKDIYPTGVNLIKAYRYILNISNKPSPEQVFNLLPEHAITLFNSSIRGQKKTKTKSITCSILTRPIHYKIFFETMNNNYINKSDSIKKWGEEETVKAFIYLESKKIIQNVEGNFYKRGEINSNFFSSDMYHFLKNFINNEVNEEHASQDDIGNCALFFTHNLSEKGLKLASEEVFKLADSFDAIEKAHKGTHLFHSGLFTKAKIKEEVIQ